MRSPLSKRNNIKAYRYYCEALFVLSSALAQGLLLLVILTNSANTLMSQNNFQQLVKSFTSGQKILHVFLTNSPHLWKQPSVFERPCTIRSSFYSGYASYCCQASP